MVGERRERCFGHIRDIGADEERRLHQTPEAHLCTPFGIAVLTKEVADLEHIWIVPPAWTCYSSCLVVEQSAAEDGRECAVDVTRRAPHVREVGTACHVVRGVNRVYHRPASRVQGVTHRRVRWPLLTAAVVFDEVDAPRCKRASVLRLATGRAVIGAGV